jgi:hypothetical protein
MQLLLNRERYLGGYLADPIDINEYNAIKNGVVQSAWNIWGAQNVWVGKYYFYFIKNTILKYFLHLYFQIGLFSYELGTFFGPDTGNKLPFPYPPGMWQSGEPSNSGGDSNPGTAWVNENAVVMFPVIVKNVLKCSIYNN